VADDAELTIEAAKSDELSAVLTLLDEAAAWLKGRGIDQWPASFSGDATWRTDRIRSYIEHGLTYLARDRSGRPVGTFTLTSAADPQFAHGWPDGPGNAGYLFRMAVSRDTSGKDLGGRLLDWATMEVGRWGKRWLRIDVHRLNPELHEYYRRHGFTKVAEVTAPDLTVPGRTRGSGTLMQREVPKEERVTDGNYDQNGVAAIWVEASNYIRGMQLDNPPQSPTAWNDALEQAARALDRIASEVKQANGMYYRTLTGTTDGE